MSFVLQNMFSWAIAWCNRPNVGYDQSYRNMQTRPSDNVICFDCSSFTFFAMWLGGGWDPATSGYPNDLAGYQQIPHAPNHNAWIVSTMETVLPSLGWMPYSVGSIAPQAGDIVVKTGEHCEMVYDGNNYTLMGARSPSHSLDEQVAIHTVGESYFLNDFNTIWRFQNSPFPPVPGVRVPIWLIKRAIDIHGGDIN